MRLHMLEQRRVDEYLASVPGAARAFRSNNIDPSHMTIANATALSGASIDEILAVMETSMRRAMQPMVEHTIELVF